MNGMIGKQVLAICALLVAAGSLHAQERESLIDAASYRALAADHCAYRVGDLITVNVQETTRAKSQAATDAASQVELGAGLKSPSTGYNSALSLHGGNSGGAQTTRVGELRAQISVQVTGVDADGRLRIEGMQALTVNGERQKIRLSGMVRPEDISSENTVWSNRIANAELELVGVGTVSESQRQSLLYRLFKWLRLM
jgi:flagellar L-ring protein precursor FlgH